MAEQNTNPTPAPATDPAVGNQTTTPPQGGAPPSGQTTPPAIDKSQSPGGDQTPSGETITIPVDELNALKRKGGRWDARLKNDRDARRNNRRTPDDYDTENVDPQTLDALKNKDDKIDELSSANIRLEVKDQVRGILDGEDYKDLPDGIKRAVVKNPLGFANPSSKTVDDVIADIQDYADDELDKITPGQLPAQNQSGDQPPVNQNDQTNSNQQAGNPQTQQPGAQQTPPAGGSGPSSPDTTPFEGTEGLSGSKRSTKVIQNILKKK